jgi:hypothetical protein
VRLLALTGCRRGEVAGLKWSEVDLEARQLMAQEDAEGTLVRGFFMPARDWQMEECPSSDKESVQAYVGERLWRICRPWSRRRGLSGFSDFNHLQDTSERVLFLGGSAYLPLFCQLTEKRCPRRIVFFNSRRPPDAPGCWLVKYDAARRTNWHYSCARDLIDGKLGAGAADGYSS